MKRAIEVGVVVVILAAIAVVSLINVVPVEDGVSLSPLVKAYVEQVPEGYGVIAGEENVRAFYQGALFSETNEEKIAMIAEKLSEDLSDKVILIPQTEDAMLQLSPSIIPKNNPQESQLIGLPGEGEVVGPFIEVVVSNLITCKDDPSHPTSSGNACSAGRCSLGYIPFTNIGFSGHCANVLTICSCVPGDAPSVVP